MNAPEPVKSTVDESNKYRGLKPAWPKGQSGNPNGRRRLTDEEKSQRAELRSVREAALKYGPWAVEKAKELAEQGERWAIELLVEIGERAESNPKQFASRSTVTLNRESPEVVEAQRLLTEGYGGLGIGDGPGTPDEDEDDEDAE